MRSRLMSLIFLGSLMLGSTAQALPIEMTVDKWKTSDGGFSFSAIHSATSAAVDKDGDRYWRSGSIDYKVDPAGLLTGDITGDVLTVSGTVSILTGESLFLDGVLDFSVAAGGLIGTFDYELTSGADVEKGTFYFYNYDFANGTLCDPNNRCGDTYRLWGNNWDNKGAGTTYPTLDNVLVSTDSGATFTADGQYRGIDLGGDITVIPEPSSVLLAGIATLMVGLRVRRSSAG